MLTKHYLDSVLITQYTVSLQWITFEGVAMLPREAGNVRFGWSFHQWGLFIHAYAAFPSHLLEKWWPMNRKGMAEIFILEVFPDW